MKVLHVVGKSHGGIRQHVARLHHELSNREVESQVIAPVGVMSGLVDDAFTMPFASRRPWEIISSVRALQRRITTCDVVHAHGITAAFLAIFAQGGRRKRPVVLTIHNLTFAGSSGRTTRRSRWIQRFVMSRMSHLIFPSEFARAELNLSSKERIKSSAILTLGRVPIDDEIASARTRIPDTRTKYHVDQDDTVITTVARLDPTKDLPLLIRAFADVRKHHKNVSLVIAGSGSQDYRRHVEDTIRECGVSEYVRLVGYVDDVTELIVASQIVAISSLTETVPLTVLDALVCGVPVVMTRTGIAQDVLDGTTGTHVPVGDVGEFASALENWIERVRSGDVSADILHDAARSLTDPTLCINPVISVYENVLN